MTTALWPPFEAAIRDLGMNSEAMGSESQTAFTEPAGKPWWPLALAGVAALGAEIVNWASLPEWFSALLALIAIAIGGIGTYQKGWIALRHGNLNINALMSIAVTGAVLLRQWPEAAMVMVLFTLAELIEAKSLDRARNAIRSLVQLTPETGDGTASRWQLGRVASQSHHYWPNCPGQTGRARRA
jgi:Cd2+/Zn2+-exporting ATPase